MLGFWISIQHGINSTIYHYNFQVHSEGPAAAWLFPWGHRPEGGVCQSWGRGCQTRDQDSAPVAGGGSKETQRQTQGKWGNTVWVWLG